VYLEFSWTHAPFIFSSIQPYPPVAIAVFLNLEFTWGGAPPSLSHGACHTLTAVTSLPLSKVAGQVPPLLPSPASLFIYSLSGECPSPTLRCSGALPSLLHVFFFQLLVYYSGFLKIFSLGGGQSVQRTILFQDCLWEYRMPLSSPGGLFLPSRIGAGVWQCGSPPGFSV
jgi:hypothetical protein